MEIREAKILKDQLAEKICWFINDFEEQTKLSVEEIHLVKEATSMGSEVVGVTLEVKL